MINEGLSLEKLFSSRGRVKVLKAIFMSGEINISRLIRITGLNHKVVVRHLEYLKNAGIIEEVVIGRVRMYRPNWLSPHAKVIDELIRSLEG